MEEPPEEPLAFPSLKPYRILQLEVTIPASAPRDQQNAKHVIDTTKGFKHRNQTKILAHQKLLKRGKIKANGNGMNATAQNNQPRYLPSALPDGCKEAGMTCHTEPHK
jgi:hypothetical protein